MTLPPPTRLESFLNCRIDLRFCGKHIGTGQYVHRQRSQRDNGDITDHEYESESDGEE